MFATLHSRLVQFSTAAVIVAGAFGAAQPANAADFCVGNLLCAPGSSHAPDLETALGWAALAPDNDQIILSGGTFSAPTTDGWVAKETGALEISGVGQGQTILTGPPQLKQLLDLEAGAGSKLENLSIQLPQMAAASTAVFTNATLRNVDISESAPQAITHLGVGLIGDGTLENSTVMMYPGTQATGVALDGNATVRDSMVKANTAVNSSYGGAIERSWLTGDTTALSAGGGTTSVVNSLLRVNGGSGTGIAASAANDPHTVVNADGLTMIAPGLGGAQDGVRAQAFDAPGSSMTVNMKNSLLRGFAVPVDAIAAGAGSTTVDTSWSDYDTSKTQASGNSTITKSNISNVANPGFVYALGGNYHLSPSSPLVDAGDPATAQSLDLDGNPSVTDGNLDGTARRDIGAFEAPGPLPPAPADQPSGPSAPAGPTTSSSGGASSTTTTTPAAGEAPVVTSFSATKKRFRVGLAGTALAALSRGTMLRYTLSEQARVTISIKRVHGRRAIGILSRSGAKGRNAVKFSGRLGKRALRPGRYVAVLVATNAAGKRSVPKQASFRVLAG